MFASVPMGRCQRLTPSMTTWMLAALLVGAMLIAVETSALAQGEDDRPGGEPAPRRRGGPGGGPGGMFDPRRFIDEAVRSSTDFYQLDDVQQEALKALLEERLQESTKLWDKVREHFDTYREKARDGQQIDWQTVREEAAPLFEATRTFMAQTRTMMRDQILDDNQKKMFDEAAARGLDTLTGREQRQWGGRGAGGVGGATEQITRRFTGKGFEEQSWKEWLDRVSREAKFTADQTAKASEMLEMATDAAAEYRRSREGDYKRLSTKWAEVTRDTRADPEARRALQKEAEDLFAPIDGIAKQWKQDVMSLLSEEQKKVAEQLERRGNDRGGDRGTRGGDRGTRGGDRGNRSGS